MEKKGSKLMTVLITVLKSITGILAGAACLFVLFLFIGPACVLVDLAMILTGYQMNVFGYGIFVAWYAIAYLHLRYFDSRF